MTHKLLFTALLTSVAMPALAQTAPAARPAQAAPQTISRAAFLQTIDNAFVAIDANKDGFTDRAELEAAEAKAMAARKVQVLREREAAFRRLDADKNGTLTLQEFNSVAAATALPKANATPFLTRLDTNKDGKVSLAENRVPAMTQFDRADANKDGTLTPQERRAARR